MTPAFASRALGTFAASALVLALQVAPASGATILFVGNSFTYGDPAGGPPVVRNFRPGSVTDLNGTNIGGVPALFKGFADQAGLSYSVSLETAPGTGLDFHYNNRLNLIARPWDTVVLQSFSTLDAANPGNPAKLIQYSALLANALHAQNPNVDIYLNATWSRADQTYQPNGFWYGQDISAMQEDVQAGYEAADANSPWINDVVPVGAAWNRAMELGVADDNPYDGITPGMVNLWAPDSYHASPFGYYLEALMLFGQITGVDPRSLGAGDQVAAGIGISPTLAVALQQIAHDQIAAAVPEPSAVLMLLPGLFGLAWFLRRARPARPMQEALA